MVLVTYFGFAGICGQKSQFIATHQYFGLNLVNQCKYTMIIKSSSSPFPSAISICIQIFTISWCDSQGAESYRDEPESGGVHIARKS